MSGGRLAAHPLGRCAVATQGEFREEHKLSTSDRQDLARQVFETSNIMGQFRLRSGMISDVYFDKYLFESDPVLLREIAQAMSGLIPLGVDALAGLEMGGIPIVTVLSQVTGIPALFVRKAAKE